MVSERDLVAPLTDEEDELKEKDWKVEEDWLLEVMVAVVFAGLALCSSLDISKCRYDLMINCAPVFCEVGLDIY